MHSYFCVTHFLKIKKICNKKIAQTIMNLLKTNLFRRDFFEMQLATPVSSFFRHISERRQKILSHASEKNTIIVLIWHNIFIYRKDKYHLF